MSASLVGSEMCIRDSFSPGGRGRYLAGMEANPPQAAEELRGKPCCLLYTSDAAPTICSV
eukprot:3416672-Alexandrium_andersonii.AAC.1